MNPLIFLLRLSFTFTLAFTAPAPYSSNCEPVGPYPYPVAVIPSTNDRYLLVSVPIHIPEPLNQKHQSSRKCGNNLNLDSLLILEALLYSKDTFAVRFPRRQAAAESLGLMILDNCGDLERTTRDLINFESCTLAFAPHASFGGPVLAPEDAVSYFIVDYKIDSFVDVRELQRNLITANVRRKPLIKLSDYDEVPERMIRSLALVLRHLTYKTVAIVSTDRDISKYRSALLKNLTESYEICLRSYEISTVQSTDETNSFESKAREKLRMISKDKNTRVLVLLTDSEQTAILLKEAKKLQLLRRWHWLGFCASLKNVQETDDSLIPPGSIMIARENDLTDFYEYINAESDIENSPWASIRNPWLDEYYATIGYCNSSNYFSSSFLQRYQENQWLQYNDLIAEILSIYDAASLSWSDSGESDSRLETTTRRLRDSSLARIMILNYRHTSKGWRFVRVGTIVDGSDVKLDPSNVQTYMQISSGDSCPETCHFCHSSPNRLLSSFDNLSAQADHGIKTPIDLFHRMELWACVLSGFAASMMLMLCIYELYAISKICRRLPRVSPIAQSGIFLSQALLYGIFLQSISIFSITIIPNFYICVIQRFLPGIACVLSNAVMLAKVLVLISARQGQYLATCYQGLIVVLFLAMQTMVSIHWLDSRPSNGLRFVRPAPNDTTTGLFVVSLSNFGKTDYACNLTFVDYLKMMTLPLCLIVLCAVMGTMTRKNPYNYRENSFTALASFFSGVVWIVWACLGLFMKKDDLQDAAFGYGLLANAFVLTVIMFLPPSRQHATTGRGAGLHPEDIISQKASASSGATWMKYLVGQSKSSSPISVRWPNGKRLAKQFNTNYNKEDSRSSHVVKPDHEPASASSVESVHSLTLQKAIGANQTPITDPAGSSVTLDIPSTSITLPNVHHLTRPPSTPTSLFNSHRRSQINDTPVRRPRASRRSSKQGSFSNVTSSKLGSVSVPPDHSQRLTIKPPLTPKPVFPTVLTPAHFVNGHCSSSPFNSNGATLDSPEITYAHVCKHSNSPDSPGNLPQMPLMRYPIYSSCLYRSRSSHDVRQCRKRCHLCLHSVQYRSRSFSDIAKNTESNGSKQQITEQGQLGNT